VVRPVALVSAPPVTLHVEIPATPDRDLSPNGRVHWARKARAVKAARQAAYYATLEALRVPNATVFAAFVLAKEILLIWSVQWEPRRKTMDMDNLVACLKPFQDGIADALGVDDKRFRILRVTQGRDIDGCGCMLVSLIAKESTVTEAR